MNQIRYFLALCRDENFTLAARHCGVSQPSLTNAIRRLERELGGQLFYRSHTRTTPSEIGQAVRPHFAQLVKCADDARRAASSLQALPTELQEPPTDCSPERMEVMMSKSLRFIAGIALVALAMIVVIRTPTSTTVAGPSAQPLTISVDDLHRSISLNALPVQEVRELF